MRSVAVVGGGIYGWCCAWRLAKLGCQVTVFDPSDSLLTPISAVGTIRAYRFALFEGPAYFPLMQRAFELWRELESISGARLVENCGALYIGAAESELISGSRDAAQRFSLATESGVGRATDFPQFRYDDSLHWVFEPSGGFLYSERCLEAARQAAHSLGVQIVRGQARECEESSSGVRLLTDEGQARFDGAIFAAGRWTNEVLGLRPLPIEASEQIVLWSEVREAGFELGSFPFFGYETGDEFLYGFPVTNERAAVKIGSHLPSPASDSAKAELAHDLHRKARLLLPGLSNQFEFETCYYTNTPDRHFIVDWNSVGGRVFVLSTCSGHGFKYASGLADVACSSLLKGEIEPSLAPFSLSRFDS